MSNNITERIWYNENEFFSPHYIRGDNTLEGFTKCPRTLEQRTKREVKGSIDLSGKKPGAKVLDVPCGYGRHSIEFAKRGFKVTGADVNSQFLTLAKIRSQGQEYKINFVKTDMRNINDKIPDKFDLVVNLSYSFGFFDKEEDNIEAMSQFFKSLKKEGNFILHTDISPEMINKGYRMQESRSIKPITIGDKYYPEANLEITERYDSFKKRIYGKWTIVEKNEERISLPEYSVRIYSQQEFENLCKSVGFRKVKFVGDWNEDFNPDKHQELIVLAEK
jgi:ubiquinone/menaquinone biosynthesis C-methylase UbiE